MRRYHIVLDFYNKDRKHIGFGVFRSYSLKRSALKDYNKYDKLYQKVLDTFITVSNDSYSSVKVLLCKNNDILVSKKFISTYEQIYGGSPCV